MITPSSCHQQRHRPGVKAPSDRWRQFHAAVEEKQILRMRFGIETDYILEEVGKQFAVTRERIRQIEARALRKLRQTGRSRNLAGLMERE